MGVECPICYQLFDNKINYITHSKSNMTCNIYNKNNLSCIFCKIKYDSTTPLYKHLKICDKKNTIDIKKYYSYDELSKKYPVYFNNYTNGRVLVRDKKVIDYLYVKKVGDIYFKSDGRSCKFDKIYISKTYIDNLKIDKNIQEIENQELELKKCPPIIKLKENEKFKDIDGNIIDITTVGERQPDKIFFLLKDVADSFKNHTLNNVVVNKNGGYIRDIHYTTFYTKKGTTITKRLYLSFGGLLHFLFTSRAEKAMKFLSWATKVLFTMQFGSKDEKRELLTTSLGLDPRTVKYMFNKKSQTVSCIYLFSLGYVKDLRQSMNISPDIPDDHIVYKYGLTEDLPRRTQEHINNYNNIEGVNIKFKFMSYIDPIFISKAENQISNMIDGLNARFKYDNYKELIILSDKNLGLIEDLYGTIGKSYMGHITELNNKIVNLEKDFEIIKKDYKYELSQKDNELKQKEKDIMILMKERELDNERIKIKDLEINIKDREIERLSKLLQERKIKK